MVRLALPSGDSEAINRKGSHATMILMAYWHGLRVSELVDLRWDQIDLTRLTSRCAGRRRVHLVRTRSGVTNCVRCVGFNESRIRSQHSSLRQRPGTCHVMLSSKTANTEGRFVSDLIIVLEKFLGVGGE